MNSKNKKWARKHDVCVVCGTSESRHMGNGLCAICYQSQYRNNPDNLERIKAAKDYHYRTKITPERTKLSREKKHFDGIRDKILERDGHKCVKCSSSELLVVHHKDKSGRGNKNNHNNSPSNLETLCRSCHIEVHRSDLLEAKNNSKDIV